MPWMDALKTFIQRLQYPQIGQEPLGGLFETRIGHVPGSIQNLSSGILGRYDTGSGASLIDSILYTGQRTDDKTLGALIQLKDLWDQKHHDNPKLGYIRLNKKYTNTDIDNNLDTNRTVRHEIIHSLFNQLLTNTDEHTLNNLPSVRENAIQAGDPSSPYAASEALAYGLGRDWDKSVRDIMEYIKGTQKTKQQLKAYQDLKSIELRQSRR